MFRTIEDLEEAVKKIDEKQLEGFVEKNLEGIAHLIKPKIEMIRGLEGFFCSNCNYNLNDVGVCSDYV